MECDSGYALRPWLLTPVMNAAPDSPEDRYNIAHRGIRSLIERTNGLLKMRFRCLLKHRVLHYKPDVASRIINSCVMLHNMCIEEQIPEPRPEEDHNADFGLNVNDNNEIPEYNRINQELTAGRRLRGRLIQNMYN
ncbi:PREDICTED: putative nuclease HARBI1 [Vollenhovia emeryi]|uniref:putative nuclease HARBI1 n=1 Tax=Vollenhovia emeryi TaxID=411798 RepID=UPI0005F57FB2|nr:PREDICTED: putative nuclease HARBI1 [Vollenhovia emeryi]